MALHVDEYFKREAPPMAQSPDLSDWPEDVRETVEAVSRVFNLRPPERSRRKGGSFAFWITTARELDDGFVECPRCKHMVNVLTLEDRCEGSHYSRGQA